MFVGGERSKAARYRIIPPAPEGQYTDESRRALDKAITEAVARAQNRPFEEVASRGWVFPTEIPDGTWGSLGTIFTLPDVHDLLVGEAERSACAERLARRRLERARMTLEATVDVFQRASDDA
ncbi:hypothetical protein PTKU46_97850 [Paraburkholderia terrae]|uniref:hypothetical protein n=1 Tax=Paraburkholderia terrae TaxID=311230 RepID=UPI0030E0DC4B